jgi:transketolase
MFMQHGMQKQKVTSEAAWNELFAQYQAKYPTEAAELLRRINGDLPAEFAAQADAFIAETNAKAETIATRKASQKHYKHLVHYCLNY